VFLAFLGIACTLNEYQPYDGLTPSVSTAFSTNTNSESSLSTKQAPIPDLSVTEFQVSTYLNLDANRHRMDFDISLTNCGDNIMITNGKQAIIIHFYLSKESNPALFDPYDTETYLLGTNSLGTLATESTPVPVSGNCAPTKLDFPDFIILDAYGFPNGEFWVYAKVDASNQYPQDTNLENNIIRSTNTLTVSGSGDSPLYILTKSPNEQTDTFLLLYKESVLNYAGEEGIANESWQNASQTQNFLYDNQDIMVSIIAPLIMLDDLPRDHSPGYNSWAIRYLPPGKYFIRCQVSPLWDQKELSLTQTFPQSYSIRVDSTDEWATMTGGIIPPPTSTEDEDMLDVDGLAATTLVVDGDTGDFEVQATFDTREDIDWYQFELP